MELKPILKMTKEEFDELDAKAPVEVKKYVDDVFAQEAEILIERVHELGLSLKDAEKYRVELTRYGAEELIDLFMRI